MKKGLKVTLYTLGVIVGLPVLGFLGLLAYGFVQLVFYSLPTDGPRVITTDDYEFTAPDGWLTSCAHESAACIAVNPDPNVPSWSQRQEWLEVQRVDDSGVTDADSFGQRATEVAEQLVANSTDADLVTPDPPYVEYDGVQAYTIVNMAARDYWRTYFVRFPTGSILRFTCYAQDYTHEEACLNAYTGLDFPAARATYEARLAEEEAARVAQEAAQQEAARAAAALAAQRARERARAAQQEQIDAARTAREAEQRRRAAMTPEEQLDYIVAESNRLATAGFRRLRALEDQQNASAWSGPGWYVINTQGFSATIERRYGSEGECVAGKPANDRELGREYDCGYFDAPP